MLAADWLCLLIWLPIKKYLLVSYLQSLALAHTSWIQKDTWLSEWSRLFDGKLSTHSREEECESMMCHVDFYQCALEFLISLDFFYRCMSEWLPKSHSNIWACVHRIIELFAGFSSQKEFLDLTSRGGCVNLFCACWPRANPTSRKYPLKIPRGKVNKTLLA